MYASRSGSAFADGARMVAVLRTWEDEEKDKLTPPPGLSVGSDEQVIVLARPKVSYAPPQQTHIWITRRGYEFKHFLATKPDPEAEARELRGHTRGLSILAFDPQSRWLAAGGSGDTTPRLWDLGHPEVEPRVLRGHTRGLSILAFDPQGRCLATGGSEDTTARLWDLAHPEAEPRVLRGHEGGAETLAFDPQGRWLASGGTGDTTARLWDLAQPEAEPRVLRGHTSVVTTLALAFDPQGRWLASRGSGDTTTARLWDLAQPEAEPRVLRGHTSVVTTSPLTPRAAGSLAGAWWTRPHACGNWTSRRFWSWLAERPEGT
jgi:WD40 repeat protein